MRINRDTPFAWQAQYLVRLEGDSDALLDVLDHIAQQHRCEFVPEATLKI